MCPIRNGAHGSLAGLNADGRTKSRGSSSSCASSIGDPRSNAGFVSWPERGTSPLQTCAPGTASLTASTRAASGSSDGQWMTSKTPCGTALGGGATRSTFSTFAAGGPVARSRANRSSACVGPVARTSTLPSAQFRTDPKRLSSSARAFVQARNPTPWTRPVTRYARRGPCDSVVSETSAELEAGVWARASMPILSTGRGALDGWFPGRSFLHMARAGSVARLRVVDQGGVSSGNGRATCRGDWARRRVSRVVGCSSGAISSPRAPGVSSAMGIMAER